MTSLKKDFDFHAAKVPSVELDWFDEAEKIRVTPKNQQRFDIGKDHAIELLQIAEGHRRRFDKQFELLLSELANWIDAHKPAVNIAYVTLRDSSLLFVVLRKEAPLDLKFEDDLSDLDFMLANDTALDLISINTMSLPPVSDDTLQSFLYDRFTLSYCVSDGE